MFYIRHLIILYGQNINKPVLEVSIFQPPRLENCISKLCPTPLGSPPAPAPTPPKYADKHIKRA